MSWRVVTGSSAKLETTALYAQVGGLAFAPAFILGVGVLGEPQVNVLKLNLALDSTGGSR